MAIQIRTFEQFVAVALGVARAQVSFNIRPEAAIRWGIISALMAVNGLAVPSIISGFRSLEKQAELAALNARFPNATDARPVARRSWHTVGLAFDVPTSSPDFEVFAFLWKRLGGRDGRDFLTPDPWPLRSARSWR